MSKDEIIELLLEDKVGEAIKAMRQISPKDGILINLSSQWNKLQNEVLAGSMSQDRIDLRHNQIVGSLQELIKRLPDAPPSSSPDPTVTSPAAGNVAPTVFLSYNHKDTASATQVKEFLRSKGINVTIDSEAMKPGEDIAAFINKCIRESDVTLSLVSNNSLLSAWVGMETVNTLTGENIANKKFIAVVIDGSFYEMSFVRNSIAIIDKRLADLKEELKYRIDNDLGFEDIQNERTRNNDLKNDLPKIIANLKNRLNVDITGENFTSGMERVAKGILG